jgi:hypothetical protein
MTGFEGSSVHVATQPVDLVLHFRATLCNSKPDALTTTESISNITLRYRSFVFA